MSTYRISYASELGWANGEAPSIYAGAVATYDPATTGIDLFRSIGELRASFSSTEIGGATVTDNIRQMHLTTVWDGTTQTREVFAYGSAGRLYRITDAATPAVTLITTVTSNTDGLAEHKKYIYAAAGTQVGRYGAIDAVGPSWTAGAWTGFTASLKGTNIKHPLHSWRGNLYAGDGNLLKYVIGSETFPTTGTTAMTLDSDHIITDINDNNQSLLIACTQDPSEDVGSKVDAWLYVMNIGHVDGTAPDDKFLFPEPYIQKIEVLDGGTNVGASIFCFGKKYLYQLVGSSFRIVTKLDTYVGPGGTSTNQGQLFWKDSDTVRAIGSPDPQLPKARYRPYASTGTSITAIKWVQDAKLWVADNNNLNEFKTGSATAVTWKSRYIQFGQVEEVQEVKIYLAANLASGDDVRVQILNEVGTATTVMTFDFTTYGAVNSLNLYAHNFTNAVATLTGMQIGILFQAGAVRVKEVIVKTKAVAQP